MITDLKNPKTKTSLTYTVQMKGNGNDVVNLPIFEGSTDIYLTDKVAALKLLKAYIEGNPGKEFRIIAIDTKMTTYDWMKQSKLKKLVKSINKKKNETPESKSMEG